MLLWIVYISTDIYTAESEKKSCSIELKVSGERQHMYIYIYREIRFHIYYLKSRMKRLLTFDHSKVFPLYRLQQVEIWLTADDQSFLFTGGEVLVKK